MSFSSNFAIADSFTDISLDSSPEIFLIIMMILLSYSLILALIMVYDMIQDGWTLSYCMIGCKCRLFNC